MVVFARVVETGNLTRAAETLGSTRSAVSKAIARLEDHLGSRVLHRTTRELSVTAAGRACYPHCARIAAEADGAERAASELRASPHGRLRVTCALSLGMLLAPQIAQFCVLYPDISLELALTESVVDLVRDGIDIGVRLGKLADSSLVARKIAPYRRVVCASPEYLAKQPRPRDPTELVRHVCIFRIGHDQWRFRIEGRAVSVQVHGNYQADTPEPIRQAALAGLGIAMLPSFAITRDLADGLLVPILEQYALGQAAIYAVYPNQRHLSATARAFIHFLVDAVASMSSAVGLPRAGT